MITKDIAKEILQQRIGESKHYALQLAIGRVRVEIENDNNKLFWIYNNELETWRGNVTQQRWVLKGIGIAKNSRMGAFLINRNSGTYQFIDGIKNVEIKSFSTYQPVTIPRIDAIDGIIELKGQQKIQFNSISELINFLDANEHEVQTNIDQLLKDQQEALELGKLLSEKEQVQLKTLSGITHYIRDNNEMRMRSILDSEQEDIKRSLIFDGLLIINGGPGTGKTTTLIQRIKFLTDDTIVEYGKKYEQILPNLKSKAGWIFFTPSNLLLGYLRNAMNSEGLSATDQTSKVWANYLNNELLKNYELVGIERPFQLYRNAEESLFHNEHLVLKRALFAFELYIINHISQNLSRISKTKLLAKDLKQLSFQLQGNAASIYQSSDLVQLIMNADELQSRFKGEFESLSLNINSILQKDSDTILVGLKRDLDSYSKISTYLKENFDKKQSKNEEEDEEEFENEQNPLSIFNEDIEIRKAVKRWLRMLSLHRASKTEKIGEKQKQWVDIINKLSTNIKLVELGEQIHFLKHTRPIVQGSQNLVFEKLSSYYKVFRKTLPLFFHSNKLLDSSNLMNKILASDSPKLHYEERNFLVLFINQLIGKLQIANAPVFISGETPLIRAYKENQKYIVGIDEASDFSIVELACMNSFSNPKYNCTTLSGDLMQRMTATGIKNWESFVSFIGQGEIRNLTVSYRQSNVLLELGKGFYENVTKLKANYVSFCKPSFFEPKPVVKRLSELETKVIWISNKIIGIYKTYGNRVPSIAIFVPNDETVNIITKSLRNCEDLESIGIEIRGVTKDGATIDRSQVNVYSIETIKGLEFEAAFIIDIDNIENADNELLSKYIYVAISRAAYYLFVTYENILPLGLEILKMYEEE